MADPGQPPVAGVSIVVPTLGRRTLGALLAALGRQAAAPAGLAVELILVDDRPLRALVDDRPLRALVDDRPLRALVDDRPLRALVDDRPLRARTEALPTLPAGWGSMTKVVTGGARGPAAARNAGWRAAAHPWIAFLDDDVIPSPGWFAALVDDLAVAPAVVGVQGVVTVPLPVGRRPTDWERVTAGLAHGRWLTADIAYRRAALAAVGGFDERFPRAFREDAELAFRLRSAGGRLVVGGRRVTHPVRPESGWVSVRAQRGNADDALLRRLYGPRWRTLLEIPPGRRPRHCVVTAAAALALLAGGAAMLRPSRRAGAVAALAGAAWLAGTAEFALARILPGPRTRDEIARMVLTSAVIPPLAAAHWLAGWWRHRRG